MECVLGRVRLTLLRWLFPKLSKGVNLELLRRLFIWEFHNVMTALQGPGVGAARELEKVFTSFIRHHVEPAIEGYISAVVARNTPLGEKGIVLLYEEMVVWLALAEQRGGREDHIRHAFEHFFIQAKLALKVLADSPTLTEGERHEAAALMALASVLEGLFRYAKLDAHLGERRASIRLRWGIHRWAAEWYPEWGEDWLPLER